MKKLLLSMMLLMCGIISAQRTFTHCVSRNSKGEVVNDYYTSFTLSPMDDNGYITTTVDGKIRKYYTYNYGKGVTEVGQDYIYFTIRNTVTGEKFLLQMFNDFSLGIRIIEGTTGNTILFYDN